VEVAQEGAEESAGQGGELGEKLHGRQSRLVGFEGHKRETW